MRHHEDSLQQACVTWFDLQFPHLSRLLHHSPNGGKRNAREGARFKAMGTRAVLYADLEEILQENGLEIGKAKWYGKKLNMAFDKYFESLSRMIGRDQTEAWANDLESFGQMFNQFAGLPTQEREETK